MFFAWLLAKASSDGEVPRASIFRQKIWSEILDGRRKWKAKDRSQEEFERFYGEVVCPLLELREEGRIKMKPELDDSDYYYREGVSVERVP